MFEPGLSEIDRGQERQSKTYRGSRSETPLISAGGHWKVVGVFDAGGSAFDSEVWCDAAVLNEI